MLDVGFIGLGRWGGNLLRAMSSVEQARVTAVYDVDCARAAKATKGMFQSPDYICRSLGEVFDRASAVVIATPPKTHPGLTMEALRAGMHVFVEKPAFMSTAEAVAVEREVGFLTFMVGHTHLYNDLVLWLKEYLDSGKAGRPVYALAQWLNWGTVRTEVDAFWNFAQHPLSILSHLLGDYPHDVIRMDRAKLQPGIADVSLVSARFGPVVAHFSLSWLCPIKTRQLMLVCEKQTITYDDVAKELRVTEGDSTITKYSSFGQFQLIRRAGDTLMPLVEYNEPLVNEMTHFVECCETGREPRTGLGHARAITEAMENAGFV